MKTLLIYFSHSGNNEKLAFYLKEKSNCKVHKITELKNRKTISILFDFLLKRGTKLSSSNIDLSEFEMLIFVSPIWGCKIATPIRIFIDKEKANIKKYSFISLCNGDKGQKEKIINELSLILEAKPISVAELSINRLLPPEKQNQIKYTFNYRITDDEIKHFSDEIEEFMGEVERKSLIK